MHHEIKSKFADWDKKQQGYNNIRYKLISLHDLKKNL